jgi:GH25 family lysozyme M1 (1,4-beta-N-acetylmuramidase)
MADPSPLLVDYYEKDPVPDLSAVSSNPRYVGAIIKASEGLYYGGKDWFPDQWSSIHEQVGYGNTWFRGCYHFLKFNQDGVEQADYYLQTVEAAGGWDKGDLWPIVDVELGSETNSNRKAKAPQVIECTKTFAERVTKVTGRQVMLYGNGAMRDLSISDRMGCDWLWCPRYTATLPSFIYERAGWSVEQLVMWQYAGDGTGILPNYPTTTPDGKKIDHSALVLQGGVAQLPSLLWAKSPT